MATGRWSNFALSLEACFICIPKKAGNTLQILTSLLEVPRRNMASVCSITRVLCLGLESFSLV